MTKTDTIRRFHVTRDKNDNIANWFLAAVEQMGNHGRVKEDINNMRVVCVKGKLTQDDRYVVLRDKEFSNIQQRAGAELADILVLVDSKMFNELLKRASSAVRNSQKGAFRNITYSLFQTRTDIMEEKYNEYVKKMGKTIRK